MADAGLRDGAGALSLETPLHAVHVRLGARMVDFAGWDMPVQYPSGILNEHQAVRTGCGVFDLSHMGRVFLRGREALALAQECCTRDLGRIRPGEAAYSLLCLPDGGIQDDVIVYVLQPEEVLIVVNASNRTGDIQHITAQRDRLALGTDIQDQTFDTVLIGVQGPQAQAVLQPRCTADLEQLAGYAFVSADVSGCPALVARTGYTGEDGFEVMLNAEHAERVWQALVETSNVLPCGLGARDTLRTEAAMALYGHEIDTSTNPYEARLGWVVNLRKPSFIGREALARIREHGVGRTLVGLRLGPGPVPRSGFPIVEGGRPLGRITSGTFSPTLKANIALGYVPIERNQVGQALQVEMRGRLGSAEVVPLPFVQHRARPRAKM